jgi:hypothetical protein
MGITLVSEDSHGLIERYGPRSVQLLVLVSGVLFIVLVAAWAIVQLLGAVHSGHRWRALWVGVGAAVVFIVWLRVMAVNWRVALAPDLDPPTLPADADEGSGVWGVGGPAMREPGNTGTWPRRIVDRRYDEPEN